MNFETAVQALSDAGVEFIIIRIKTGRAAAMRMLMILRVLESLLEAEEPH